MGRAGKGAVAWALHAGCHSGQLQAATASVLLLLFPSPTHAMQSRVLGAGLGVAALLLLLLLLAAAGGAAGVKAPVSDSAGARTPWTPWSRWRRETELEGARIEGSRIPRKYFVTKGGLARSVPPLLPAPGRLPAAAAPPSPAPRSPAGFGETDLGAGTDPFETGAWDLAVEDAGM